MFGSRIVVYSTRHEGGALILRHGGEEWTFNSAEAIHKHSDLAMDNVAFFSDVEHEVTVVTSGYRATLTYNLYFAGGDTGPALGPPAMPSFEAAINTALDDLKILLKGGLLGFGLSFQYLVSSRNTALNGLFHRPKGNDAVIKAVCDRLSLRASLKAIRLDEYTGVSIMVNEAPDLNMDGQIEGPVSDHLRDDYGGRVDSVPEDRDDEAIAGALEVLWITPLTDITQFVSTYIHYGNEAPLQCFSSDVCLPMREPLPELGVWTCKSTHINFVTASESQGDVL